MTAETRKDRTTAERLIRSILQGSGFSGFRFDTAFSLRFDRSGKMDFEGHEIPWILEIQILSDWWFGTKNEWKNIIEKFESKDLSEPEEPLKAFELTRLRWAEGSTIEIIDFHQNYLSIVFKNKKLLSVSFESDEDYAWIIKEPDISEENSVWSIVCEGGEFYVRTPST